MEHYACGESALRCSAISLAIAALLALGALPCRSASAEEAPATQAAGAAQVRPPASAPAAATAPTSMPARGLLSHTRPAGPVTLRPQGGISGSEAIWRMLASMLVITVLGLLCYVMVKRVMPRIVRPGGRTVRVLETACLERGQRVHVLSVGTEKYLVASGRAGVTVLANVTQALCGDDRPPARTSGGSTQAT